MVMELFYKFEDAIEFVSEYNVFFSLLVLFSPSTYKMPFQMLLIASDYLASFR
jgi:hypothetical protein